MTEYRLERQQWLPRPPDVVFAFFSDPANLARITPPWMGFRIRTPLPIRMADGTRIEYTIRLAGLPLTWRSRITEWNPPREFADVQERGPYAVWEHTHRFEPLGDGVLMTDVVRYRLPFGILGRLAHALAVRGTLAAIFDYRFERVRDALQAGSERGEGPVTTRRRGSGGGYEARAADR